MKKIEAVIRPSRVAELKQALSKIDIKDITLIEAGSVRQPLANKNTFEFEEYDTEIVPKMIAVLVLPDDRLNAVLDVIQKTCYTGDPGDGKIFISSIEEVIKIRTRQRGDSAV